jgi:hypothetical protein
LGVRGTEDIFEIAIHWTYSKVFENQTNALDFSMPLRAMVELIDWCFQTSDMKLIDIAKKCR